MFVGDVRGATMGAGVSWKLSGGSQFSPALTNVSKKRHVWRAVLRRKRSCSSFNSSTRGLIGWLMVHASHGATTHSPRTTLASGHRSG